MVDCDVPEAIVSLPAGGIIPAPVHTVATNRDDFENWRFRLTCGHCGFAKDMEAEPVYPEDLIHKGCDHRAETTAYPIKDKRPEDNYQFEVWQDGTCIAEVSASDLGDALREARHYAAMYSQDGPVQVFEVTRRELGAAELGMIS